jgi:hypothetical protein
MEKWKQQERLIRAATEGKVPAALTAASVFKGVIDPAALIPCNPLRELKYYMKEQVCSRFTCSSSQAAELQQGRFPCCSRGPAAAAAEVKLSPDTLSLVSK